MKERDNHTRETRTIDLPTRNYSPPNEKGNSQNATTAKHNAMSSLSNWMTKFIELARNAFIQEPQLMESLNIVVKS